MKTITRIFATLCVLGAAAACQQYEIDTQMTPEKEYANLRLVCDALTTYSVPASRPDNITFNVSALDGHPFRRCGLGYRHPSVQLGVQPGFRRRRELRRQ